MSVPRPDNPPVWVSLNPKDNTLGTSWVDQTWVPFLNASNVLDYFAHCTLFYDPHCNNEQIRMQRLSLEHLKNMIGIEYDVVHFQEPVLFVIRKQQRLSPTETIPLSYYYILAGTIYQCPDLWSIINARLTNASHFLCTAEAEMSTYVRYHPSNGYSWDIKSANNSNGRVSFAPLDYTKKETEDTGTQYQRKNVDNLLGSLSQAFPYKPLPTVEHPFGPRALREQRPEQKPEQKPAVS